MRSPTHAILWEICARNRWPLAFAFGAIPLCAAVVTGARLYLHWIGYAPSSHSEGGDPWQLVGAASLTILLGLLSLTSLFWSFDMA